MADVELVIKIPKEIMEYIKNNGCLSVIYNNEVAKAISNGTPLPKYMAKVERRLLMEVDGGTDDKYLRYEAVCDRISNTFDTYFKAENEGEKDAPEQEERK